jgi:hypothetical protein
VSDIPGVRPLQTGFLSLIAERAGFAIVVLRTLMRSAPVQEAFPKRNVVRYMGDVPLKQQMEAFSDAGLIVAPHGAGLVNLIFAPNHAKVIEIYNNPRTACNYCYFALALGLRLKYRMLLPLKTSDSTVDFNQGDISRIVETANAMLATG